MTDLGCLTSSALGFDLYSLVGSRLDPPMSRREGLFGSYPAKPVLGSRRFLKRREKMKTRIVTMACLILIFAGCTRQGDQSVPEGTEAPVAEQTAVEPKEAAEPVEQAEATVEEDQEVKSCLQLVSEAKYTEALPVCLSALEKDPANKEVKAAAEKAQEAAGDASGTVTDTMKGVQEAAGQGG
jgi:hypothetical protein